MKPPQQSIQRDEAGAAAEDLIESCAPRETAALAEIDVVGLEIGVGVSNQLVHALLGHTMQIRELKKKLSDFASLVSLCRDPLRLIGRFVRAGSRALGTRIQAA